MRLRAAVIFILMLILDTATVVIFVYFFAGGRQALTAKNYVKQHPAFQDSLYAPAGSGRHGGILAGVWGNKIWLWTREGLRPYQGAEGADYTLLIGCGGPGQGEGQAVVSKGLNIEEWQKAMRPGDFAFVVMDEATPAIVEKVWGVDYWMFMVDKEIEEQCRAAGRAVNGQN